MHVRCSYNITRARGRSYASNTSTDLSQQHKDPITHFIFGANTDVGKTVLTSALVQASYERQTKSDYKTTSSTATHYIKPLQCGGSDESFIRRYAPGLSSSKTLFDWKTPVSPHFASRIENKPVSDDHVSFTLNDHLRKLKISSAAASAAATMEISSPSSPSSYCSTSSIWIETAGGVLSPSSSSPNNYGSHHAKNNAGWGWSTQADLYMPFQNRSSVVLVGDGRLGGISTTISSLEVLMNRNYTIGGILLIQDTDSTNNTTNDMNQEALKEYIYSYTSIDRQLEQNCGGLFDNPDNSIISLPKLPPEPEPLNEWFASNDVKDPISTFVHNHLFLYDRQKRGQQHNTNKK